MESTTSTYQSNAITCSNCIKAYFYKDQDYYFVITSYDNIKLTQDERKCVKVLIDFIPLEFVEYEFEVVEATSSYFHLRNFLHNYYINFVQDTSNEGTSNTSEYDYNHDEPFSNIVEFNQENNVIETCDNTNNTDDEMYYSDSEDGYDSEGYYFRVR
jgi:hypothetical protein